MKIIICISRLIGGGAERVACLWANGFSAKGHDVTLMICGTSEEHYYLEEKVKIVNVLKEPSLFDNSFMNIIKMRRIFRKIKPDVIITILHPSGLRAWFASVGLKIPIINTEHNTFERPEGAKWSFSVLAQKFYINRLFRAVTVLTNADRELIKNRFKHIYVLPNPLAFKPLPHVAQKEKLIMVSGRLDAWFVKGLDMIIQAWASISTKYPEWEMVITGEDLNNSKQYLLSLWPYDDRQLSFAGFCDNIDDYYKRASIFVLSSRCEGFGMVLVEAMSQGCACISTDYKGRQREIISNEEDGIIVNEMSTSALSQSISSLIENPAIMEQMQNNALKRASHFTIDRIMEKWDVIFREVLHT